MAAPNSPDVGELIDGRYQILNEVAQGGMATVFRAHDERLDRVVALKIVHPQLGNGSEVTARFRREARAAAGLIHPNVVGVFDQGMSSHGAYLAMEYVSGTNLRDLIQRHPEGMPVEMAAFIIREVLLALDLAHHSGIIHRDIKPENILISERGQVKVADFGLARAVSEATASLTGSLLGTIAYVAPEVVMAGESGPQSDLYSLGVMWFEMLNGQAPFDSTVPLHVAFQHIHEDLPYLSEQAHLPDTSTGPGQFDELIHELTARNFAERMQSAGDALNALDALLASLEISPISSRELGAQVHSEPAITPLAELATTSLTHSATEPLANSHTQEEATELTPRPLAQPQAVTNPPTDPQPSPPAQVISHTPRAARPRRSKKSLVATLLLVVVALGIGIWWFLNEGPGAYTSVPAVAGESEVRGTEILDAVGFEPSVVAEYNDSVPQGQIIATEPAADSSLKRGSSVTIKVSLGVLMVVAPEVEGKSLDDALAAYASAQFSSEPVIERVYHDEIPVDEVISSSVTSLETVRHDVDVVLTVSDGREPATLPSISADDTLEQAQEKLTEAGLKSSVAEAVFNDTVPAGHIVSVDAADELFVGDVVLLTPSKGPELIMVPNVKGKQYNQAAAELSSLGFEVERNNILGGYFNTVRDQSVAAGGAHPKGTVIILTVV